jgi:hypothetical protein
MELDNSESRLWSLPKTDWGRWSVRLLVVFLVLFPTWIAYSSLRQIPRPTFFSDPIHVLLLLPAAASAVLGGVLGLWSALFGGERSFLTLLSILVGGFVAWWGAAEIFFPH